MMLFTRSIICFLISQYFVVADDDSSQDIDTYWFYAYTIGIIIASILITLISIGLVYLTLRCLKRKRSQSEYNDDIFSIEKDTPPPESQIQPIITVSEVVSSIKQSLEVLGNTVMPKRWLVSREESSVVEKPDLSN